LFYVYKLTASLDESFGYKTDPLLISEVWI